MRRSLVVSTSLISLLLASSLGCAGSNQGIDQCVDPSPAAQGTDDTAEDPEIAANQSSIAPTTEHAFSILDMLAMARVSSPVPSPDGAKIAFIRRDTDMAADRGRTSLWVIDAAGGEPRRLTSFPEGAGGHRWAADAKSLYFLSSHSGSSQA